MIYKNEVYNHFFKDLRKSKNYTTKDLANMMHYSVGTINSFENDHDILSNPKTPIFLKVYDLPENYLSDFNEHLKLDLDHLIDHIIYLKEHESYEIYQKFCKPTPYHDTILDLGFKLGIFIYKVFNREHIYDDELNFIISNKELLTSKYKAICNIYIGLHYIDLRLYSKAKESFDEAGFYVSKSNTFKSMYEYCLAKYYIKVNNPMDSIRCCNNAVALFISENNYLMLLNAQMIIGLQYTKMNNFNSALRIYRDVYTVACNINNGYIQRKAMFNSSFIYILKHDYQNAIKCLENIPTQYQDEKVLCAKIFTYFVLEDIDSLNEIFPLAYQMSTGNNKKALNLFSNYLENKDDEKLLIELSKFYKQYKNEFTDDSKEFLLSILMRCFEKKRQYKKAYQYLSELYELNIA